MYQLAGDKKVADTINEENRHSEAIPEDLRVVEVLVNGTWKKSIFKDLKEGNTFRLTDPKTKQFIKNSFGETEFVANTDAYLTKHKTLRITVYHVQIRGRE